MGIPESDLEIIFLPYFRTSNQTSRELNKNSHGLGLSICKKIAEKLNGTLEVTSFLGEGTTFTFSFVTEFVGETFI